MAWRFERRHPAVLYAYAALLAGLACWRAVMALMAGPTADGWLGPIALLAGAAALGASAAVEHRRRRRR